MHLLIAPTHAGHALAHSIYFGFAGMMEFGWAVEFWRDRSRRMYLAGMALAVGLVLLWALTRIAGAPFATEPEPIDASAIMCKASEIVGAAALAILAWQGRLFANKPGRSRTRTLAEALGLALAVCLLSYGLGRVAEPLLPGLWHTQGIHASGSEAPRLAVRHRKSPRAYEGVPVI